MDKKINHVFIEGVKIELTGSQVFSIEKELRARIKNNGKFETMLRRFGFTKIYSSEWQNPNQNCWENKKYDWFAEIIQHDRWSEIFMAGQKLKNVGFPGGYNYGEVGEATEALCNAINEIENGNANLKVEIF